MIKILIIAAVISLIFSFLLIRSVRLSEIGHDKVGGGVQKFHTRPTPRLGGIPILLGCLGGAIVAGFKDDFVFANAGLLAITALPLFTIGLMEDLTQTISPRVRLLAAMFSAILAIALLQARLHRLDIPLLDNWMQSSLTVSIIVTLFAVTGVSHAINIIDGFNGLAGVIVLIILSVLTYVSYEVGDKAILAQCLLLTGATLGFLVWNYPFGLIFAGDAGAYLWGFMIAEISILLVIRNPIISPWFPLLLCIYPIWETLFSMYRKQVLRHTAPSAPDGLHLHMLIYKRLVCWMKHTGEFENRTLRNALTSPYLWGLNIIATIPAMLFWQHTSLLVGSTALFIAVYLWLYNRIVHFKTPKWLIFR